MTDKDFHFTPAGGGERVPVLGMTHINKVTPDDMPGAFFVAEVLVPPGCGAPLHRHLADSECFYVLEGTLTFETPSGSFAGRPGDVCYLPAGGAHAFRNETAAPARALAVVTPGMAAHAFFTTVGERLGGRIDPPAVVDIGGRYGLELAAPPA